MTRVQLLWMTVDRYEGVGPVMVGQDQNGGNLSFRIDPWGRTVVTHTDGWFDTYEAGNLDSARELAVAYWRKYRLAPSPGPDEIRGLDSIAEEVFNDD